MIFYTNNFVPDRFAGIALGPFIFIRPQYKGDIGLAAHEQVHVKQFWGSFCLYPILYLVSDKYRLASEVEAYKVQLTHYTVDKSDRFAEYISTRYRLKISKEEALRLLTE